MNRPDIAKLKAEWAALQLQILAPAELTDEQWAVIWKARKNLAKKKSLGSIFVKSLPIVVARFTEAAQKEIKERAQKETSIIDECMPNLYECTPNLSGVLSRNLIPEECGEPPVKTQEFVYLTVFESDMNRINNVLFGRNTHCAQVAIGCFYNKRLGILHADVAPKKGQKELPAYVSRLVALPTEFIAGKFTHSSPFLQRMLSVFPWIHKGANGSDHVCPKLKKEVNLLIEKQKKVDRLIRQYHHTYTCHATKELRKLGVLEEANLGELRKLGVLEEANLGDVVMMATGKRGTLHRSGDLPNNSPNHQKGIHSALYRVVSL